MRKNFTGRRKQEIRKYLMAAMFAEVGEIVTNANLS